MINKLHICGFRSFKDLTVEGLGRVNLITGRNNVGKSTLLEAVRLWATEGDEVTLLQILSYREESQSINADNGNAIAPRRISSVQPSFSRLSKAGKVQPRVFLSQEKNGGSAITITARIDWLSSATEEIQGRHYLPGFDEATERTVGGVKYPILRVETPGFLRVIRLNRSSSYQIRKQESFGTNGTTCLFLDPFSSRATSQLASMWDQEALSDSVFDVHPVRLRALPEALRRRSWVERASTHASKCLGGERVDVGTLAVSGHPSFSEKLPPETESIGCSV